MVTVVTVVMVVVAVAVVFVVVTTVVLVVWAGGSKLIESMAVACATADLSVLVLSLQMNTNPGGKLVVWRSSGGSMRSTYGGAISVVTAGERVYEHADVQYKLLSRRWRVEE